MSQHPLKPFHVWPGRREPLGRRERQGRTRQTTSIETPTPTSNPATPQSHVLLDAAIYTEGRRLASPSSLEETYQALDRHSNRSGDKPGSGAEQQSNAIAWIDLLRPSRSELDSLAAEFGLHELAIEDAILARQRPKLERYGNTLFVVVRGAWYIDETEDIAFGELHLFVGPSFVVTIHHGDQPDLAGVRRRMEHHTELLRLGTEAILYAILDSIVDGYGPVVSGLATDIDEIETQVFHRDQNVSRRIYELNREVIEFQRATRGLAETVASLRAGFEKHRTDQELQSYLRDVEDHLTQVSENVEEYRHLLRDVLSVNATLVAQQQNEEMRALTELSIRQNDEVKKISSWAAILFAPTLVGTVYGMNFDNMPELHWHYGYVMALALMAAINVALYLIFRKRDWI